MLAIIGGTGLAGLANLEITHRQVMRTPYGEPSGTLTFGKIGAHEIVFLARHGAGHRLPPHEINYRANIWALAQQNVKRIIAVASVGGIRADLVPGSIMVPDQIIDYTHNRKHTFFEGGDKPVVHIDFTDPYSTPLRDHLVQAAAAAGIAVSDGGTYACTQGPRLETAAEIRRLERDGGDVVGMTGMPEAALAREMGIAYACVAVVANYAAGKGDSAHSIDLAHANSIVDDSMGRVLQVLASYVNLHDEVEA